MFLRGVLTDCFCEAAGGPETYDAGPVRESHLRLPLTPDHVERAVELLSESLEAFDVPAEDAEAVVGAVAAHEEDLLARPDGASDD